MSITITKKISRNKEKNWFAFEWGKGQGQRLSTGIFTYNKPKDQIQKNHNKEAIAILETKRSQMLLDQQSISTGYIPQHKIKSNFLDFYREFVKQNSRTGNRHLLNSLLAFQKFLRKDYISSTDIHEEFCQRFRQYLLDNFNGETPADYFLRFKRVLRSATKQGYFRRNPSEDLTAKANKNIIIKEILSPEEYSLLLKTPCKNYEVQKAFVFSLYTGLRWIDIKHIRWDHVIDKGQTFRIHQKKTGIYLERPLHEIARQFLGERKEGLLFYLPSQDGANKLLKEWCNSAGINKNITWHCARHSFSVLLQDKGIDTATVAGMLGHSSTKYVHKTYQRYKESNAREALDRLPMLKA